MKRRYLRLNLKCRVKFVIETTFKRDQRVLNELATQKNEFFVKMNGFPNVNETYQEYKCIDEKGRECNLI